MEQYTRKNSLEIHGVPEDAYTSTEEVVLKLAEALDVHILSVDIEISHKVNTRNKSIIVKFLNHKVKTKLYKSRTKLKHIKAADLFPSRNYSSAAGREPRIFMNENLTDHRRRIISKANKMRKDQLIQSACVIDQQQARLSNLILLHVTTWLTHMREQPSQKGSCVNHFTLTHAG